MKTFLGLCVLFIGFIACDSGSNNHSSIRPSLSVNCKHVENQQNSNTYDSYCIYTNKSGNESYCVKNPGYNSAISVPIRFCESL